MRNLYFSIIIFFLSLTNVVHNIFKLNWLKLATPMRYFGEMLLTLSKIFQTMFKPREVHNFLKVTARFLWSHVDKTSRGTSDDTSESEEKDVAGCD